MALSEEMSALRMSDDSGYGSDELSEYGSVDSGYSNGSNRSLQITLCISTTPFELLQKGEGYMFATSHVDKLSEEITNFKAGGDVITWTTSQLPPRANSTDATNPLHVVTVWLKQWDSPIKTYLVAVTDIFGNFTNRIKVVIVKDRNINGRCIKGHYWNLSYHEKTLPSI